MDDALLLFQSIDLIDADVRRRGSNLLDLRRAVLLIVLETHLEQSLNSSKNVQSTQIFKMRRGTKRRRPSHLP